MSTFSDYIFSRLSYLGLEHVFGVSGGGIMHLTDAIYRNNLLTYTAFHHESHAGYAADSASKIMAKISCVVATTGPGAANVIPSIITAFQDSSPVIFITGQAKLSDSTLFNKLTYLRTLGPAEFDIVTATKSFTKKSFLITDVSSGIVEFEEMLFSLLSCRPGPFVIDIPLDVQGSHLEQHYFDNIPNLNEKLFCQLSLDKENLYEEFLETTSSNLEFNSLFTSCRRPLLFLGSGIEKEASTVKKFFDFLKESNLPYVCSASCKSLYCTSLPNYLGNPGIRGCRSANIALENCDLLIIISSSLHPQVVGWDPSGFASKAKKVYFDIDRYQLEFLINRFKLDFAFNIFASSGLKFLINIQKKILSNSNLENWYFYVRYLRNSFLIEHFYKPDQKNLSYYQIIHHLNDILGSKFASVISDAGSSWYVVGQTLQQNTLF